MKFYACLILAFAASLFAELPELTPVQINGQLKVDQATGKILNKSNYPIQLRGMSSHGLQWHGGFINPASLYALRTDWGADVVRLSMYMQEGGYEENPQYWRDFVDSKIEEVTAAGMYVIIDFHQLYPGDPWYNIENAVEYFTHMAQTHADKNNVIYEICNEPNSYMRDEYGNYVKITDEWGNEYDVDWPTIKSYADSIIPIIRRYDEDNIVIVGTPQWDQRVQDVIGNEIDDPNVMYSLHFYATAHTDTVRCYLQEAINAKLPLFVTESGTQEASGGGVNDWESSKIWYDMLDEHKISWINWNFSPDSLSGAAFTPLEFHSYHDWFDFNDTAYYMGETNLKPAGQWIRNRMRTPDDFGVVDSTIPFTVSVSNGVGGGEYSIGETVTLTAVAPQDGLVFAGWSGDLHKVTGTFDSVATFVMSAWDLSFSAYFVDPSATIDTAALSNNFVSIATWSANSDDNGSSATFDNIFLQSGDTALEAAIYKADYGIVWSQVRAKPKGDFSNVNVVKLHYSSDQPVEVVLDNPVLDPSGSGHYYALPASEDTVVYIPVDSFYQQEWALEQFIGAPQMDQVESISIGAMETGMTNLVVFDLALNRFHEDGATSVETPVVQQRNIVQVGVSGNSLVLNNLANGAATVALFNLRGQQLFKQQMSVSSSEMRVALPSNLSRNKVYILAIEQAGMQKAVKISF